MEGAGENGSEACDEESRDAGHVPAIITLSCLVVSHKNLPGWRWWSWPESYGSEWSCLGCSRQAVKFYIVKGEGEAIENEGAGG